MRKISKKCQTLFSPEIHSYLDSPSVKGSNDFFIRLFSILCQEKPFDPEIVRKGLSSTYPLRLLALQVVRDCDIHGLLFPEALRTARNLEPGVYPLIREILSLDPLLAFQQSPSRKKSDKNVFSGLEIEKYFSTERISLYNQIITDFSPKALEAVLPLFFELPGITRLDIQKAIVQLKKNKSQKWISRHSLFEVTRYPSQLGIIPSYSCNMKCSFCFSATEKKECISEMSLEQCKRVIDAAVSAGFFQKINLFGGEPLVYHHIGSLLQYLDASGLPFFCATNAVVPVRTFQKLLRCQNLEMVTIHVRHPFYYTPFQFNQFLGNLAMIAADERVMVILRYTMVHPLNRDWDFLKLYLSLVPKAQLSFAIAFPSQTFSNQYVKLAQLKSFSNKIIAFSNFIKNLKSVTRAVMAKPFPPCFFEPLQLNQILHWIQFRTVCELEQNNCTNQVMVRPDEQVIPCMALNDGVWICGSYQDMSTSLANVRQRVAGITEVPLMESCRNCRLFQIGACQAACFSYQQNSQIMLQQ